MGILFQQVAVMIVLHETLIHLFNVLKYQCFMEARQTFLFLPSLMTGETEVWETWSVEQVRGRFESRSRLCASCLPGAGFPQNPAAISIPEHFSLVQCFQAQSLSCIIVALCSSPGMRGLFGGETSAVNGPGVIYSPLSASCQPGFLLPHRFV